MSECACGAVAYSVASCLFFIMHDLEHDKVTSSEDLDLLEKSLKDLSYCGIETSKILNRFAALRESLVRRKEARTSPERYRAHIDALLDHDNLEKEIGESLEKCRR